MKRLQLFTLLIVVALALAACGGAAETEVAEEAPEFPGKCY